MEYFTSIITATKEAGPRIYCAVFIVCLALIGLPASWVQWVGLEKFKADYQLYLALGLIVSFALLLVHFLFWLGEPVRSLIQDWRFNRNVKLVLQDLTEDEKVLVRKYIFDGKNTCYESIYAGVANGLEAKGIVYRASQLSVPGTPGVLFPYNLQPYARKILQKNPSLLAS